MTKSALHTHKGRWWKVVSIKQDGCCSHDLKEQMLTQGQQRPSCDLKSDSLNNIHEGAPSVHHHHVRFGSAILPTACSSCAVKGNVTRILTFKNTLRHSANYTQNNTSFKPKHTSLMPNLTSFMPDHTLMPNLTSFMPNLTSFMPNHTSLMPNHTSLMPNLTSLMPNVTSFMPNLTSFMPNLTSFMPNHTSLMPNHTSFMPNLTSFMPNLTSFMPNHTTFTPNHTSTFTFNHSTLASNHTSFRANETTASAFVMVLPMAQSSLPARGVSVSSTNECPLSTCVTSNLGSALQGGDEKAGQSTVDPDGFGKK
ncbi:high mobility group protein 20A isoform X3 [Dunckerocampus dactyliophorus]|uniref:high mobility group protein 20A isoform X3 n=1 Tax=Dunckerocampus dactyliophorus TaxID=161453 RepID=UPI0024068FEB|nr:high mobility group protein 20A isoform X3 [Dunckerocampus dactyliophorus]